MEVGIVCRSEHGQSGECGCGFLSWWGDVVGVFGAWQQLNLSGMSGVLPDAVVVVVEGRLTLSNKRQHQPSGNTSGRQVTKTKIRKPRLDI
jgi:hypothetical protein